MLKVHASNTGTARNWVSGHKTEFSTRIYLLIFALPYPEGQNTEVLEDQAITIVYEISLFNR